MIAIGKLVTPTGILVMSAKDMHADHERWLSLRDWRPEVPGKFCIGASEVPSILDLDGVDTPAHVYRRKVWKVRQEPTEEMEMGHELEPFIANRWCRLNRAVIDEIGLVANVDQPWIQATIDRRVRECPVYKQTGTGECGLEVKNVGFASASRWHADIPDRILAQILVQLFVTGYGHIHYACLVGGNRLRRGIVYADREQDLTAYIIGETNRFRDKYLIAGVEPEWDISRKADRLIELDRATYPERVGSLDIDGVDAVYEYADAARASSLAKKRQDQAKARLLQLAAGHEVVTFADELAYRFGTTRRTNVDLDRLKELHPDAYADPSIVSETVSHPLYLARQYKTREE